MSYASELMLAALKAELDGGRMLFFSGPVPASADDALDMDNDHTQLVEMTEDGDGVTGLTFEIPSGNTMVKAADETWSGLIAFDGAEDSEGSLTATFYRFCPGGDDGRSAATGPRLQGTIGTTPDNDIVMANPVLTDNGTNTQGLSYFAVVENTD